MIIFGKKSGMFLDSMENFHLFWNSFQIIFASGQVSHKILEKKSILSGTFPDSMEKPHLFWKSFRTNLLPDKFPTRFQPKSIQSATFPDSMKVSG